MVSLIDTNVIIRFLAADVEKQHLISVDIMNKIRNEEIKVEILSEVIMEVLFIMTKFYNEPKNSIIEYLQSILLLDGVVNKDKFIIIETLSMMHYKNIDFVDSLICVKSKMQGYGKISFDKNVMKKCEN